MSSNKPKVETVIALASRKSGVSLAEIQKLLRIGHGASLSLIGDVRRSGTTVRFDVEDGVYRV